MTGSTCIVCWAQALHRTSSPVALSIVSARIDGVAKVTNWCAVLSLCSRYTVAEILILQDVALTASKAGIRFAEGAQLFTVVPHPVVLACAGVVSRRSFAASTVVAARQSFALVYLHITIFSCPSNVTFTTVVVDHILASAVNTRIVQTFIDVLVTAWTCIARVTDTMVSANIILTRSIHARG